VSQKNFEQVEKVLNESKTKKELKIGVVGVFHTINVGNNLLKYAISVVLKEMGFIPYIIATSLDRINLSFLRN